MLNTNLLKRDYAKVFAVIVAAISSSLFFGSTTVEANPMSNSIESNEPISIVRLDASVTDGKTPEKMQDIPPVLSFPKGQGGGESILERVFYASRPGAIFDIHFKRYLHEKMTLVMDNWPVDEFFYILEGKVKVTNTITGKVEEFQAGDTFIVPLGFEGKWDQLSPVHMFTIEYGKLITAEEHMENTRKSMDSE